MIEVRGLIKTCPAHPSQWEFKTFEDRPVYVRYRWGGLAVSIGAPGANIEDAVSYGYTIVDEQSENDWGGYLDWPEVESKLRPLNKEDILLALKDWEKIREKKIADHKAWEFANRDKINSMLRRIEK